MPEKELKVKLLSSTPDALSLIYAACRQCYSAEFAGDIFEKAKEDSGKMAEFITKIAASGHESPLEHVKFTFAVQGVSRALTHQLVRHRLASYSQQSQRYVKEDNFSFIVPPTIKKDPEALKEYEDVLGRIQKGYNRLLHLLKSKGIVGEKANQDARFVLPQGSETKIVITMNARELLHFFSLRCCSRAQWEIKALADKMLVICKKELPAVFSKAGAKCEALEYCPEGKKFTCGRYPLKKDVIKESR
ncbi:MAG: FAD-dependent thymidylate synthase [Candidatus Omnitrophica bacterium]|nr:FAD-dependent thymidylate synthase [Candidatus Omnitrophota bacterium]